MNKIKNLLAIIFLLLFFSCLSEEEKFIQAEFDKVNGIWKIESLKIDGMIADSVKKFTNSGLIEFGKCKYKAKQFDASRYCAGQLSINDIPMGFGYKFDNNSKKYTFVVNATITNIDPKTGITGKVEATEITKSLSNALSAEWEISIVDNKLIARQTKNTNFTNLQVTLTANRE